MESSETFLDTMQNSSFNYNHSLPLPDLHQYASFYPQDQWQQGSALSVANIGPKNQTDNAQDGWLLIVELANLYEPLLDNIWQSLLKLRFLFYLVWPTETMFSSLKEVPRYVTEVSSRRI